MVTNVMFRGIFFIDGNEAAETTNKIGENGNLL